MSDTDVTTSTPDPAEATPPPAQPEAADPEVASLKAELASLRADLEALTAERDRLKDQALRATAEAENTRRRLEREKAEAVTYAAAAFARDILVVADNLDRALACLPTEPDTTLKPLADGLEAVRRELHHVFDRHGIQRVEALGQPLDPMHHQAMVEMESDSPPGTIVAELQPGYRMKDRLLRPALVGVARARAATEETRAATEEKGAS
ncbi:MAG: nucleotide exchange factor GrpE [Sphingomonadaceae bacterium]|uniref:nucleotide exchange factor GrpE n=1 Tax=Thermaurantiacus sp. TaxID=2820283 RepID=UPI00298EDFE2|nr:nucleotide exchange factor GrpE [Thermaurantiacus sp.]MCS6986990.1 nucleotide exchange factor GrpE [Sphingomonadaceae bacterium]MDW8415672.1 nucleotide exchange factor GrpE [Thermaurantiacus sp.]